MCGECLNNYYVYDTATSVKEISKEITAIYNMFQMIIRLYKENSFEAMIRYLKLRFLRMCFIYFKFLTIITFAMVIFYLLYFVILTSKYNH